MNCLSVVLKSLTTEAQLLAAFNLPEDLAPARRRDARAVCTSDAPPHAAGGRCNRASDPTPYRHALYTWVPPSPRETCALPKGHAKGVYRMRIMLLTYYLLLDFTFQRAV